MHERTNSRVRMLVLGVILAVFAAACSTGSSSANSNDDQPASVGVNRGDIARDFTIYDIDGNEMKITDFRGQAIFLNFWASWCRPCRAEMPSMDQLQKLYGDKLVVLALVGDQTIEDSKAYFIENGFSYTFATQNGREVSIAYRVSSYPATILIAPDGTIVAFISGATDWSSEGCQTLIDAVVASNGQPVPYSVVRGCD